MNKEEVKKELNVLLNKRSSFNTKAMDCLQKMELEDFIKYTKIEIGINITIEKLIRNNLEIKG